MQLLSNKWCYTNIHKHTCSACFHWQPEPWRLCVSLCSCHKLRSKVYFLWAKRGHFWLVITTSRDRLRVKTWFRGWVRIGFRLESGVSCAGQGQAEGMGNILCLGKREDVCVCVRENESEEPGELSEPGSMTGINCSPVFLLWRTCCPLGHCSWSTFVPHSSSRYSRNYSWHRNYN